ncbi:Transposase domain, partial [Thermoflavimicrobium dichotomicum]
VMLFKMLLIGYLYGIRSERRLIEEIRVNIAYRWFVGLSLTDRTTPLHLQPKPPAAVSTV